MKVQTIVGIFIFISKENFKLIWVEHENSFMTSGPGYFFSFSKKTKIYNPQLTLVMLNKFRYHAHL